MKAIIILLTILFICGAVGLYGLMSYSESWPVIVQIGAYAFDVSTMVLILVMLISAPRMAKMMQGKAKQ